MLVFENVVFKNILNYVDVTFPRRTYLIGAHSEGKTTLFKMLCKNRKVSNGEIYLQESFLKLLEEIPSRKDLFFFVPSDIYKKWFGIKLRTIYSLFTGKILKKVGLISEYNLDPEMKFEKLNNFEKLIFYTHIAKEKKAVIILYDEPLKYLDYIEREYLEQFMEKYHEKLSFIISMSYIDQYLLQYIEDIYLLKNKKIEKIENPII